MSYEIITVITILHKKLSTREIKYFAQNPQQWVQNQDPDSDLLTPILCMLTLILILLPFLSLSRREDKS